MVNLPSLGYIHATWANNYLLVIIFTVRHVVEVEIQESRGGAAEALHRVTLETRLELGRSGAEARDPQEI